ncbi:hypothetical protein Acsp05_03070 [Actinokineospora sp. NBRC 105648]|nr:hypothetical protein Acsp05_03070 [Actinokineospora sp. NBRC 105648]
MTAYPVLETAGEQPDHPGDQDEQADETARRPVEAVRVVPARRPRAAADEQADDQVVRHPAAAT